MTQAPFASVTQRSCGADAKKGLVFLPELCYSMVVNPSGRINDSASDK